MDGLQDLPTSVEGFLVQNGPRGHCWVLHRSDSPLALPDGWVRLNSPWRRAG